MVELTQKHFKINCMFEMLSLIYLVQGKKYDTKDQIAADLETMQSLDHQVLEEITLSGNSYGREACNHLAAMISAQQCQKLTTVNFNDMFVSRKLAELPGSLEVLIRAVLSSKLVNLNLSDNAFGSAGIKTFDFLLKEMVTLKSLKVTNCGLGPVSFLPRHILINT
jgi:Ran GTPase-activating protein 1